jgi:hypothetical protein
VKCDAREAYAALVVLLAAAAMAVGCVSERRWGGVGTRSELRDTPVAVRYRSAETLPGLLDRADYRAIEDLLGRVSGLGDPVWVTGVFPAWQDVKVAVLFRTERYDVFIVRDSGGRWLLSEVTNAPVP